MSGILRPMGRDGTGYDFLAGKDEGYRRAWNEAVETIARLFAAAEKNSDAPKFPIRSK